METYGDFLKNELDHRKKLNPKYSLRAFSRDLGLSPSNLSEIINGDHGFSKERAKIISKKLKLSEREQKYFFNLSSSKKSSKAIQKDIPAELFYNIRNWYFHAITELSNLKGFKSSPRWIAKRLGLKVHEAKEAISKLDELGIDFGKGESFQTESSTPSRAIRGYHQEMLALAQFAIDEQSNDEREYSSNIFAIEEENLEEAKKYLKKVRRDFVKKFSSKKGSNLYNLSVSFFRLTKK